jgi:hypothetical protein
MAKAKATTTATKEAATPDLAALLQENEQLKATNAALVEQIEKLSALPQPAAPVANVCISTETFELSGQQYGFALAKMNFKGKLITSAEVLADDELQKQLIAMKSGMIKAL